MKESKAIIFLFIASFIWGMAFIFQRMAVGVIGPIYFNAIRMLLAVIVMLPFFGPKIVKRRDDKNYIKTLHKGGFWCGILTAIPCITQQIGIQYTTAGKAGFITSLYILLVPILTLFLGKKVTKKTWICIAAALVGAYFLSISGKTQINKGDLIILSCAVLFSFQMICIEHYVKQLEGLDLSMFQFMFGGLFSLALALCFETISFQIIKESLIPLLYTGILSCGVAYSLQAVGQKYVPVSKASLPLSLENAWSAVGGFVFLHELMTVRELIGCVILFAAVIISQISIKKGK